MKTLALIATILLSLGGYSVGVVLKSGKAGVRKAVGFDIVLVVAMWAGAVVTHGRIASSRWLLLAIWFAAGLVSGWIFTAVKGHSRAERMSVVEPQLGKPAAPKKRFPAWREFSAKAGSFQSQIFLGLLFLVIFAPVGLAVRLFSDPLRIKNRDGGSHWMPKKSQPSDLELFRKQS